MNEIQFGIKNFKSIKSTSLTVRRGLNILVGPNGAGKTCLFSSIQFVKDVIHLGAALAIAKAGGPKRAYHHSTGVISFTIKFDYGERTYNRKKKNFFSEWNFSINQGGEDGIAIISEEKLSVYFLEENSTINVFQMSISRKGNNRFNYSLANRSEYGRDLFDLWGREYAGKNKETIRDNFIGLLKEFGPQLKEDPDKSFLMHIAPLDKYFGRFLGVFKRLNEYNILPNVARSSVEQLPYARMESNGGGVAEVIYALEKKTYHKIEFSAPHSQEEVPYFDRIRLGLGGRIFFMRGGYSLNRLTRKDREEIGKALDRIQSELSAGVRPISEVATQIDQTNGRRFVIFKSDEDVFYPEEVSDGTMKWLCILVSIYVPNARLYLLEEPENFLHPWMQQRLIENMRMQAEQSETFYLLTSHSTTVLNASYPNELRIVCPSEFGTVVEDVPNLSEIEEALTESNFGLGDLWVSGAIEGVPTYEG